MEWTEYREKLGIGFSDKEKAKMLIIKLCNYIEFKLCNNITEENREDYFIMICEPPRYDHRPYSSIISSIGQSKSSKEALSKYIAFCNTYKWHGTETSDTREARKFLLDSLSSLGLGYEIITDNDGMFVFPKGAKELDNALVSEPLEWLLEYPETRKTFIIALKQYSDGIYIRDTADNLRKALETFLQEFLDNTKNLETNKNIICKYLGEQGVDPGVVGLFQPLINSYKNINDRIVKHNDAVDKKLLEFLLYQTGVLIRMVISIKKAE